MAHRAAAKPTAALHQERQELVQRLTGDGVRQLDRLFRLVPEGADGATWLPARRPPAIRPYLLRSIEYNQRSEPSEHKQKTWNV